MGLKWIEDKDEKRQGAGWAAISSHISIVDAEQLDVEQLKALLDRVSKNIHEAPNRVRYTMNNFVIAAGGAHAELTSIAKSVGKSIGKVSVNMGGTACKVPDAVTYIEKVENMGRVGKKKKMARC